MTIDEVIIMVDDATEEEVRKANDNDLSLIYDFYVVSYYTGGDGNALTPATFVDFWKELTMNEKKEFISNAFV
jgi:hypothetical protein